MTDSPESRTLASPASFAALLQKGVERIADFQRITLDLCAHQTADIVDSWKRFSLPGASYPGGYLAEIAGEGMRHFVEMQKNILDLMVQQSLKGIEFIRPAEIAISQAAVLADLPSDESMDRLLSEHEEQVAIATKVVDRIEELVSQAPPVLVPDVAVQQARAAQAPAPPEKSKLMVAQGGAHRHPGKRTNAGSKQKNDW